MWETGPLSITVLNTQGSLLLGVTQLKPVTVLDAPFASLLLGTCL